MDSYHFSCKVYNVDTILIGIGCQLLKKHLLSILMHQYKDETYWFCKSLIPTHHRHDGPISDGLPEWRHHLLFIWWWYWWLCWMVMMTMMIQMILMIMLNGDDDSDDVDDASPILAGLPQWQLHLPFSQSPAPALPSIPNLEKCLLWFAGSCVSSHDITYKWHFF